MLAIPSGMFTTNSAATAIRVAANAAPRSEWVVQRDTHPALVSDAIAETVLQQIESSSHSDGRQRAATYLLTGILKTPAGASWYGNRTERSRVLPSQGRQWHA